jgi:hypothetical protein
MLKVIVPVLAMVFLGTAYAQDAKSEPKFVMTQLLAAALQPVNGKVIDTKTFGNITVVHAKVTGADHSEAFFIMAKNRIFNVDDYANLSQLTIKSQVNYAQLAQKFPNIGIWPGNHTFPKSEELAGGITQLVFTYSLLNGCHACELAGIANVGFNFDKDGNYIGQELLSLSPPPINASPNK